MVVIMLKNKYSLTFEHRGLVRRLNTEDWATDANLYT